MDAAAAAAQARAIAARLAGLSSVASNGSDSNTLPHSFVDGSNDSMKSNASTVGNGIADDPVARARAIAARFGLVTPADSGNTSSVLGKRKAGETSSDFQWSSGNEHKKKTKVFLPSVNAPTLVALFADPKSATQRLLEEDCGAHVRLQGRGAPEVSGAANDVTEDLHVVIVTDTDEQLERATNLVQSVIKNPQYALDLKRSQLAAGSISGMSSLPLGGTMVANGMRAAGGAVGAGPPMSVAAALAAGGISETFNLPNSLIGAVIGRGGDSIRELQARYLVHVHIQRETDIPVGAQERGVTVSGPPDAVALCKAAIWQIVESKRDVPATQSAPTNGAPSTGGPGGPLSIVTQIPDEAAGLVIGKQGSTIRSIQTRNSVHVTIPKEADPGTRIRSCVISGHSMESLHIAQAEIQQVLNAAQIRNENAAASAYPNASTGGAAHGNSDFRDKLHNSVQCTIPDVAVGSIIGRAGSTIKDIQFRTGARINIPREADPGTMPLVRTITITGTAPQCEAARVEIESIAAGNRGRPNFVPTGPNNANAAAGSFYGAAPFMAGQQLSAQQYGVSSYGATTISPYGATVPLSAMAASYPQQMQPFNSNTTAVYGANVNEAWKPYYPQQQQQQQQLLQSQPMLAAVNPFGNSSQGIAASNSFVSNAAYSQNGSNTSNATTTTDATAAAQAAWAKYYEDLATYNAQVAALQQQQQVQPQQQQQVQSQQELEGQSDATGSNQQTDLSSGDAAATEAGDPKSTLSAAPETE